MSTICVIGQKDLYGTVLFEHVECDPAALLYMI